eukprot:6206930-Pleurochrysis_carterae.AAC.4
MPLSRHVFVRVRLGRPDCYELSEHDPHKGAVREIRAFASPVRFATHTGVRGHYIMNSSHVVKTKVVNLPNVVEFNDEGVPDALALSLKLAENCKSKEGNKKTWVDERKCSLIKLDLIKTFKTVEKSGGCCALGKQLDRFLNYHSTSFKAATELKMRRAAKAGAGGRGLAQSATSAAGAQENYAAEVDNI